MPINICCSGGIKSSSAKFSLANKTPVRYCYLFASVKMLEAKSSVLLKCVVFELSVSLLANADNMQNIHKQNKSKFNSIVIPLFKEEKRFQALKIEKVMYHYSHVHIITRYVWQPSQDVQHNNSVAQKPSNIKK